MSNVATAVRILDIIQETYDTQTFRLGSQLSYKAGQAICLTIPGDPKKRYFSIASSPTEKGHIDITIKAADKERPLFGSLFSLKKGSEVEVAGPMGSFTLAEPIQGPYYFLAGGSGITPFRSMIKYVLDTQPNTEMWLFYSIRTPEDVIFKEEFFAWSNSYPCFHFVPTFTRSFEGDVKGETGRVGEALLRKHLKLLEGTFFLCGPKEFVKDMEQLLIGMKIPAAHIRREAW